jgi:HSP20 family protein
MVRTFTWDPWQELDTIRGEISRLIGRGGGQQGEGNGGTTVVRPAMGAHEKEDAYILTLDMPGVTSDRVEVEVEERGVRIRGERGGQGDANHVRYERMLTLPENADVDGIEAEIHDGVLTVEVPKRKQATPKKIPVRDAHGNYAAGKEGEALEALV